MSTLFQVFENSFIDHEEDSDTQVFLSFDKTIAIQQAQIHFENIVLNKDNTEDSDRPELMEIRKHIEVLADSPVKKFHYDSKTIFVAETPLDISLKCTKVNVIWSPSLNDIKIIFSKQIQALVMFDLNTSISLEEINELWDLFLKDVELFRKDNMYGITKDAADLLKLLSEEEKANHLNELEKV